MRIITIFFLSVVCVFQLGCATIISNEKESILVRGLNNETANVRIIAPNITYSDKLPISYSGKPEGNKNVNVIVNDKCYEASSITVNKDLNSATWLNILFSPGFIVDYSTGAMWDYEEITVIPLQKKTDVEGCDSEAADLPIDSKNLVSQS
jgi:hypothetical protein